MGSKKSDQKYYYGVGRRKRSTARAKVYPGSGDIKITINGKEGKEYFSDFYFKVIENMMTLSGLTTGEVALFIRGGGTSGQSEAARLAIAKALVAQDEGNRPLLRLNGFLTTDIRKVLPKRPGLRKARKREQWSKR